MKNLSKFIVIDIEATCWEDSVFQKENSEIIEIGVSLIDFSLKKVIKKRSYLVKNKTSTISDYCTNLTGITQQMIDKDGHDLMRVSKLIRKEFSPTHISWGAWGNDNEMLLRECDKTKSVFPFNTNFTDISHLYSLKKGNSKKWNLSKALTEESLSFIGNKHSGMDDSFNTARLFVKILCGEVVD
jgi:inhibitor of KinA sporulation pathway (predicted exonuclease)